MDTCQSPRTRRGRRGILTSFLSKTEAVCLENVSNWRLTRPNIWMRRTWTAVTVCLVTAVRSDSSYAVKMKHSVHEERLRSRRVVFLPGNKSLLSRRDVHTDSFTSMRGICWDIWETSAPTLWREICVLWLYNKRFLSACALFLITSSVFLLLVFFFIFMLPVFSLDNLWLPDFICLTDLKCFPPSLTMSASDHIETRRHTAASNMGVNTEVQYWGKVDNIWTLLRLKTARKCSKWT